MDRGRAAPTLEVSAEGAENNVSRAFGAGHRITVHFTPRHASWLKQIEIWFSILARKLIQRGNFTSKADLRAKINAFIDVFNKTMAKPFKWTYAGKPLTI